MKRYCLLTVLLGSFISGCAKPDRVITIKSPTVGVFYTVETFKAGGPASDTTRVYAHFERNGEAKRLLVLEGGNLTVKKIIWNDPHDVTVCLDGGITETFRNHVTLIVGDAPDDSETINNSLQEHCNDQ